MVTVAITFLFKDQAVLSDWASPKVMVIFRCSHMWLLMQM